MGSNARRSIGERVALTAGLLGLLSVLVACGSAARRFPTAGELERLGAAPVAARSEAPDELDPDEWTLSGPFPSEAGDLPLAPSSTPWETVLRQEAERRAGLVALTEGMACAAFTRRLRNTCCILSGSTMVMGRSGS